MNPLHRIGLALNLKNIYTKLEKTAFNIFNKPNYVEGNLMIRQKRFDEYDWVIYKNKSKENNKRNIIYKDDKNNFIETEVTLIRSPVFA